MIKRGVTELDTSKERILKFLEETKDTNYIHREPQKILPGIFYLVLAAPYLNTPLSSLELKFRKSINYPCSLDLIEEDYGKRKEIIFTEKDNVKKVFCECNFEFLGQLEFEFLKKIKEREREEQNQGLENFADIAELSLGNENLRKIWLTCLIPGKLIEFFQGGGIYWNQTMNFKSDYLEDVKLKLEAKKGRENKKAKLISTIYENSASDVIGEGEAIISIRQ